MKLVILPLVHIEKHGYENYLHQIGLPLLVFNEFVDCKLRLISKLKLLNLIT